MALVAVLLLIILALLVVVGMPVGGISCAPLVLTVLASTLLVVFVAVVASGCVAFVEVIVPPVEDCTVLVDDAVIAMDVEVLAGVVERVVEELDGIGVATVFDAVVIFARVVVTGVEVTVHGSRSFVSVCTLRLLLALQLHPLAAEHDSTSVRLRATPLPHSVLIVVQVEG